MYCGSKMKNYFLKYIGIQVHEKISVTSVYSQSPNVSMDRGGVFAFFFYWSRKDVFYKLKLSCFVKQQILQEQAPSVVFTCFNLTDVRTTTKTCYNNRFPMKGSLHNVTYF